MYEKDAPHVSEELWTFIEEKQLPVLSWVFATVSKKSLITMEAVLLLVPIVSMVLLK